MINRRLASLIESQGNYFEAQRLYEKSILDEKDQILSKEETMSHNLKCQAGIAKTSIKIGDAHRGFQIAEKITDQNVLIDIAMVCEKMNCIEEAAALYEKAGLNEKAAGFYIQLKRFKNVMPLISTIKNTKLLLQLAKAKESDQSYKEAEQAYEQAEDWENVIRLNLTFCNDP